MAEPVNPLKITIDLSVAIEKQLYEIAGHNLYVLEAPRSSDYVYLRFNHPNAHFWKLQKGAGFNRAFAKFYITTPAGQTGNMVLSVGTAAPLTHLPIDNRMAAADVLQSMVTALENIDSKL